MISLPNVSVVVPVFNEEMHISRAIRSLLAQSLDTAKYELIIVDDASSDRTGQLIALFEQYDNIRVLKHETNMGLAASLNTGVRASRGQYFVRVDGDDYVHQDYLYILSMFLEQNKDFGAVACDYLLVRENEELISRENCLENPIGCGIMFRRENLISLGMYDPDFRMNEDKDLRLRFEEQHSIVRIPLPLYRYRQHDGNMTRNKADFEKYETKLRAKHAR